MGMQTDAKFTLSEKIRGIYETDMLEENGVKLNGNGTAFSPFEIKTFLLYL